MLEKRLRTSAKRLAISSTNCPLTHYHITRSRFSGRLVDIRTSRVIYVCMYVERRGKKKKKNVYGKRKVKGKRKTRREKKKRKIPSHAIHYVFQRDTVDKVNINS